MGLSMDKTEVAMHVSRVHGCVWLCYLEPWWNSIGYKQSSGAQYLANNWSVKLVKYLVCMLQSIVHGSSKDTNSEK